MAALMLHTNYCTGRDTWSSVFGIGVDGLVRKLVLMLTDNIRATEASDDTFVFVG